MLTSLVITVTPSLARPQRVLTESLGQAGTVLSVRAEHSPLGGTQVSSYVPLSMTKHSDEVFFLPCARVGGVGGEGPPEPVTVKHFFFLMFIDC